MFEIDRDLTMLEIMRRWPATVPVLIGRGIRCVGCPVAGFRTLPEAARAHGVPLAELERALADAVARLPD